MKDSERYKITPEREAMWERMVEVVRDKSPLPALISTLIEQVRDQNQIMIRMCEIMEGDEPKKAREARERKEAHDRDPRSIARQAALSEKRTRRMEEIKRLSATHLDDIRNNPGESFAERNARHKREWADLKLVFQEREEFRYG